VTGRLDVVLSGRARQGVYRWRSRAHRNPLGRELGRAGWRIHPLPGSRITGAGPFFDECAGTLALPCWFAHTWDGLADCLADLSWLPDRGHVLLWDQYGVLARRDPKVWRQAYESFATATSPANRHRHVPLYVLLRGNGPDRSPVNGAPIPLL
jgi:hypothetical protein